MNQRSGLERMVGALVPHVVAREMPQFVVDGLRNLIERFWISFSPRYKQTCEFGPRRVHRATMKGDLPARDSLLEFLEPIDNNGNLDWTSRSLGHRLGKQEAPVARRDVIRSGRSPYWWL